MDSKTILIADDDVDIRLVIRMRLEQSPYRILEAGSGQDALRLIQASMPDVVLLDWQMPDISGQELLTILRADRTFDDVKVIVITGEDQAAKEAVHHGAFASLLKPFGPLELIKNLEAALG
jgi:two-component system phosphate regulon response regulator PhoB